MVTLTKPIEQMKAAHNIKKAYNYKLKPVEQGYANRTLYINLSDYSIEEKAVTDQMKDIFTGGRGFALWLLWQSITDNTKWDDPSNDLVIANGPIGGTTAYPGLGKSTVVTISPLTKSVIDSNVGGYFGPYLKFSGFDALEIHGKAPEDVFGELIIVIDGDTGHISIETAPLEDIDSHLLANELAQMYGDGKRGQYGISTVTAGQAAEHINYACLNFSWYDVRRKEMRIKQAGRGGTGRVFRDKGLKAIVVKFNDLKGDVNNPVDKFMIRQAGKRINKEIADLDDKQNQMRKVGTAHLVEIMDHFDLLPVHNFRYGAHPESGKIDSSTWHEKFTQGINDSCWAGCTLSCSHGVDGFPLQTGPYQGQSVLVDGPEYENVAGLGSNIGVFDPLAVIEMNFYCDTYGVDTISFANCVAFVMECWQYGILDAEKTGGLDLSWGNANSALELLHQMARGEGFGLVVGQGSRFMKLYFAEEFGGDADFLNDIAMETKGLEISEYMTKESIAQQGGYGLALKGGQHDEAWLIFMDQVNKQLPTWEDKAEALHYFPMWRTWFSLHGLCKLPWNDILPENNADTDQPHKVPEHVENYTWLYEGLTGKKISGDELIAQSERVYNFQRVFNLRLGFGTRQHDTVPYRAMGPVTVDEYESRQERYDEQIMQFLELDPAAMSTKDKIAALRKYRYEQYAEMTDAVYKRRGWNENGIPTVEKLKDLGIDLPEVVAVVEQT